MNQADALEKLRTNIRLAVTPARPVNTAEVEEKIRKGKIRAARLVECGGQGGVWGAVYNVVLSEVGSVVYSVKFEVQCEV